MATKKGAKKAAKKGGAKKAAKKSGAKKAAKKRQFGSVRFNNNPQLAHINF